ncbi:CHAT domain-containing protein [Humitalea rosea]|uniref:CHAT domain-containing protein n=1 Tax=Humitalea rosea TaxID=990373 RepID=A0A2W7JEW4_9PROT|nr:CHAT domain-containing tetratricopeptide repeat protein [Humitalea rosea]PZW51017.1 CHAT domain-containing protein [Humitalea rosea]
MRAPGLLLLLALAACQSPPESAYVAGSGTVTATAAGQDARGEACTVQTGRAIPTDTTPLQTREVFCGGWTQPAARLVDLPGGAGSLEALASGGAWRAWVDQRYVCAAPTATSIAGGARALLLACTRKAGGWPQVAMVIEGPRGPVLADGVSTVVPVIERLASGQTSTASTGARSEALELAVARLSAGSFGASEVGRFDELMSLGLELNQAETFGAAEEAYRQALAVQERTLGAGNPNTVTPLMHLALNLSNQRRLAEAEVLFRRADALAPGAADPVAVPRLLHYRALHALNGGHPAAALPLLNQAEARYATLLPRGLVEGERSDGLVVLADPVSQSAILGLAEARRSRGIVLARLGRPEDAATSVAEGRSLLRRAGLEANMLTGRALRTAGQAEIRAGRASESARLLNLAAARFAIAAPGERPEAVTLFLVGQQRAASEDAAGALSAFRSGAAILRARQISLPGNVVMPYLDTLAAEAARSGADRAALQIEMFGAAQLAQRSGTVRFVQQATARLGAASGDPRVAEAVRKLQDAERDMRQLFTERDAGTTPGPELDRRITEAQGKRGEAEAEVAAAAPSFRQLLLASVDAGAVQRVLGPDEAMVTMLLGETHGYVFAILRDRVMAARTGLNEATAARMVGTLREATAPNAGASGPGRFDVTTARALYDGLLGPLEPALAGATRLVVAPDGPLLSLPFGMLLTGPADPAALGAAPWLIRRFALEHVPGPQTLVSLRAATAGSSAPLPYAGFGDFVPATATQLAHSFPPDRCAEDARLASGLGRLPGTRAEVSIAGQLLGAAPDAIRLGPEATKAALLTARLDQARILHLATHALLPGELSCLPEPTIVLSTPAGAADASAAFLTASEVLGLKLDADLVILSACNTGGPGGAGGGEALSGLARAFFYAGARGLMITHWAVDDTAATLIVADTLRRQAGGASSAAALQGAQQLLLDEAGRRLPAAYAHPYYWAPFALLGDGRREVATPVRSAAAEMPARL